MYKYNILLFIDKWTTNLSPFYFTYLLLYLLKNDLVFLLKPLLMTA